MTNFVDFCLFLRLFTFFKKNLLFFIKFLENKHFWQNFSLFCFHRHVLDVHPRPWILGNMGLL